VEHDQAMQARHAGELTEAVAAPAGQGNGWVLRFGTGAGAQVPYTAHSGVPKVFHTLDHMTEIARELGFASIRVEEVF
jgi:hypothetical protein